MALNTSPQYAGDARIPFAFGGSGRARIVVPVKFTAAEAEATGTDNIFKIAKRGVVNNFAIWADDLDTHATPTLVLDVGIGGVSATDVDEFIDGATVAQTGVAAVAAGIDLTSKGFVVAAGDYITLTREVGAPATKGAAGTVWVSFDLWLTEAE